MEQWLVPLFIGTSHAVLSLQMQLCGDAVPVRARERRPPGLPLAGDVQLHIPGVLEIQSRFPARTAESSELCRGDIKFDGLLFGGIGHQSRLSRR